MSRARATAAVRRLRGQAMVESVAAVGVMIALYLGVLYVGRLHEVQSAVIQAGRFAAFAAALNGPDAADAAVGQAGAHLLAWHAEPVRAGDSLRALGPRDWLPALADHSAAGSLWPAGPEAAGRLQGGPLPGLAGLQMRGVSASLAPARALAPAGFDPDQGGWIHAEFGTTLRPGRAALPWLGMPVLGLQDRTVVAAGDWSASGPARTAARVAGLAPASGGFVRGVVGPALALAQPLEPSLARLCLGRVDPEIVPADRLVFAAGAPRGAWWAPC